jgi:hypothetical protein
MEFSQHGEFELSIDGRLLVVDVVGPWNLELIQNYTAQVAPLARQLASTGPWVLISVARRSVLFTPEAIEALRETAQRHSAESRRVATAYVVGPTVEGYQVVNAIFEDIYRDVCPMAIFETRAEAEGWAAEQLRLHKGS